MNEHQNSFIQYKIVKSLPINDVVELYKEGGWWTEDAYSRNIIPLMIEGSFCFLAVFDGDTTIGMGRVISDGCSDAYIQDVVVKKKYRGRGIGTEIILQLTQYCIDHKLTWIALIAEEFTAPFYERCGFKVSEGERFMILEDRSGYE